MKSQQLKLTLCATVCVAAALGACSDGGAKSHSLPWDGNRTQVINGAGDITELPAPNGDACLDLQGACIQPQLTCEGRAADVVLDGDGKLVQTVCYPAAGTLTVSEIEANNGNVAQNQNNSVIVLDDIDDGIDIDGDVSVDANNVVIYGADPNNAVISGNLSIDGNNTIVRGVRIQGDVSIVKNNAVFLNCVIEGDVTISANDTVIAACDVLGTITITGNNTKLSANHIVGELSISGNNTKCTSNVAAVDADGDGILLTSELGAPVVCD